ncbi:nucleotidyltransferase domain-containing protein [Persephonella sp.]
MNYRKDIFKYLTDTEIKAVFELKEKILELTLNAKLIFYGSKAKGEFDDESDIDLLIIIPNLTRKLKYKIMEVATEVELKYDVVFGLIIISEEKYEKSNLFKGSLYYNHIKREGLPV